MILYEEPALSTWSPTLDQSVWSGKAIWTRLAVGGAELSNSLDHLSWRKEILYPVGCEACGQAECEAKGVARVVRLGCDVLWLKPSEEYVQSEWWYLEAFDLRWRDRLTSTNAIFAAQVWDALSRQFRSIRPTCDLAPATKRDLVQLWFDESPDALRGDEWRLRRAGSDWLIDALRHDALAADPVELPLAANRIGRLIAALLADGDEPADGRLIPIGEAPGIIESIFLDGDPFVEWPAALIDPDNLVIDGRLAWVRETG